MSTPEEKAMVKIPIALVGVIVTLAIQTGGWIWWAATLSSKMEQISRDFSEQKTQASEERATRFTKADAALVWDALKDHEGRIRGLENRR